MKRQAKYEPVIATSEGLFGPSETVIEISEYVAGRNNNTEMVHSRLTVFAPNG